MLVEDKVKGATLEEEFKRNPECPVENFHSVKSWMNAQGHLPKIPDQKLFQFLFSCFYDVEKTKKCIDIFYGLKTNWPELYSKRDLSDHEIEQAFKAVAIFTIPILTPKRYRITYLKITSDDASEFDFVMAVKLFLMAYDAALFLDGTARGHVIIFDCKNVGFRHLMKCNLDTWKKVIKLTQEALPVRKKTLHVLNTNYFIYKFAQMLKPFIIPEVFNTIHLHRSTDMEEFYKIVPIECLPNEYGGPLESPEILSRKFQDQLRMLREYFSEDDKQIIKKKS
ncbi:alpha-tocopherol transfer protein-like isoform X2 [Planococcus citri]|uniref:alpha-tocopherol transfer protein-like isoform X2 n=1 Tax=Planococcus citri TaxID=170843 RepID=UPI0031F95D6E